MARSHMMKAFQTRMERRQLGWRQEERAAHLMARLFPNNPPGSLARVPYGYFDTDLILQQLLWVIWYGKRSNKSWQRLRL